MIPDEYQQLPIEAEDHGGFAVWDLRGWDGDVETMAEINEAWVAVHTPEEKVGTISVFPEEVIVHGEIMDFISEGWNEASEATGLEYLAIVGEGLQTMAVKSNIEAPNIEAIAGFEDVQSAVGWMDERVA